MESARTTQVNISHTLKSFRKETKMTIAAKPEKKKASVCKRKALKNLEELMSPVYSARGKGPTVLVA